MEHTKVLGIYVRENSVTALCLDLEKSKKPVIDLFMVDIDRSAGDEEGQQSNFEELAELVKKGCDNKDFKPEQVAVALDNSLFMQHDVHSPFTELKQINQTIRFDTEEALATDVNQMALAFKINSSDESGSELTVFTAEKEMLAELITAFQGQNLDPAAVEPDIICLSRSFMNNFQKNSDENYLFSAFSKDRGYMIVHDNEDDHILRTFLSAPGDNATSILKREVPITLALNETDEKINSIKVLDVSDDADTEHLTEFFGIDVSYIDAGEMINADTGQADAVSLLIAHGAALNYKDSRRNLSFRRDFMPFLGKKLKMDKSLKMLGVSLAVLFIAIGIFLQIQWFNKYQPYKKLHVKFSSEYADVMMGKDLPDKMSPSKKLRSEFIRVQKHKSGQLNESGEKSVAAKFAMMLEVFNKIAKEADLNIQDVSITSKNIRVSGDTSNRSGTLKFFKTVKDSGLIITKQSLESEGGRDTFRIDIQPRR